MLAMGLLGAALFFVVSGAAELVLRGDRLCRAARAVHFAFNPRGCQEEALVWWLKGLSRGVVGALRPEFSPLVGVATMAAAMFLIGALLGLAPLRRAVPIFLALHALLGVVFAFLGFLVSYLA